MRALHALASAALLLLPPALASNFTWTWPTSTAQCDTISMYIYGGVAPWTLFIIPVDGMPILWNLGATTDTATASDPASFTLPLALNASTDYVVYIEDSETGNEYNVQGNPKEVQTVQSSGDDSCMSGVKVVEREFYFTVGGDSVPCGQMGIYYDDAVGRGPYSLTIIPLDGSFHPYDVAIGNTSSSTFYWGLQLEEGTRYTMMMSNYNGHGVGGIASIYSVDSAPSGSSNSCITGLDFQPTGTWPSAVYTTAVGALTASVPTVGSSGTSDSAAQSQTAATTVSSPGASTSSGSAAGSGSGSGTAPGGKSNAGVIGGAVGGAVGGLLILSLVGWLVFRRRKYHRVSADGQPPRPSTGGRVDLGDDYPPAEEGDKVVPFPSPLPPSTQQSGQPQMEQRGSYAYPTGYVLPDNHQQQQPAHLYPGDQHQGHQLATIPLGYTSPSGSQSQSQSQSQSGSSTAWAQSQSPTSPSGPTTGGVASVSSDPSHGTRNSKMMQEYLRQSSYQPQPQSQQQLPPGAAPTGPAFQAGGEFGQGHGQSGGAGSPHSPSSAGPWSSDNGLGGGGGVGGHEDPEIILHQDGGAVLPPQPPQSGRERERIELPPTYFQASGQQ